MFLPYCVRLVYRLAPWPYLAAAQWPFRPKNPVYLDQVFARLGEKLDRAAAAEQLPDAIGSFLEDLQETPVRQQKAQLQTILKAAYVL